METLRTLGPAMSPFNAFMFLQGLENLHVRMDRHVENAIKVAEFLSHEHVSWVTPAYPPALITSSARSTCLKAVVQPCLWHQGQPEAGVKFIEGVEFLSHLANVGDAKTLVIHPASTTHRQLNEEQLIAAGVGPDMIRMSIGLESIDDILWDVDQALSKAAA